MPIRCIDAALASDPIVGPCRGAPATAAWGATRGRRPSSRSSPGRSSAARQRSTAAVGEPLDLDDPAVDRLFLSRLAGADLAPAGLQPGRKLATIAGLEPSGRDLDGGDPARTLEALRAVPGVGSWTSAYVAMRVLRDPDAFPAGDAAVRAAFHRRGLPSDDPSIARAAEAWRPWRGYAVAHLWSAG
jgi:AraC family transcriptional regulator of adaptative response / DNA-3-methyladenine glycosylase II